MFDPDALYPETRRSCFLVMGESGQWSTFQKWPCFVFEAEMAAYKMQRELQAFAVENHRRLVDGWRLGNRLLVPKRFLDMDQHATNYLLQFDKQDPPGLFNKPEYTVVELPFNFGA